MNTSTYAVLVDDTLALPGVMEGVPSKRGYSGGFMG